LDGGHQSGAFKGTSKAGGGTKKGGPNRLPRLACHCTNRPFFQDTYVKYLMAPAFQKKPEIFLRGVNARFS
jgi:hypothetical protein